MEEFFLEAWNVLCSFVKLAWTEFKWPHAALVISFIFTFNFKKEIRAAINRLNKLGPKGAEFGPSPQPEELQKGDGSPGLDADTHPEIAPEPAVPVAPNAERIVIPLPPFSIPYSLSSAEQFIRREIAGLPETEAVEYLVSRLSMMRVLFDFENTYSTIFGGQIKFLIFLNQRTALGCNVVEAEVYFQEHKLQFSPHLDAWTVDQYLSFVIGRELISKNETAYFITLKGKDFLVWLTQTGKAQDRPW